MNEKLQSVIALGFFDGVHLGHGALLRRAAALGKEKGLCSRAITFDRSPGKDGGLLTSVEDRSRLIRSLYAIDEVVVLPFTEEFMRLPWDAFLRSLVTDYGAAHLVCGWDYHFGHLGAGDPQKLAAWCRAHGLGCDVIDKCVIDGITVSSTFLKGLMETGDTEAAIRYYGHPHTLSGVVRSGRHLGRTLGFPTANLQPEPAVLLPRRGVYAVRGIVDGQSYPGVCNVGVRPTVDGGAPTVETWLSGFDGDLYGRELTVEFYRYLRPERKFPSLEELRRQVFLDRAAALVVFPQNKPDKELS